MKVATGIVTGNLELTLFHLMKEVLFLGEDTDVVSL